MQTKELTPASTEVLNRLVAAVKADQLKLHEFLTHTAMAMGLDFSKWEFNFDTNSFHEKVAEEAKPAPRKR